MRDASSYFTSQLSGGFSVDQKISMSADNYGYESDSDLEDIESEDQHDDSKTTPLESDRDTEQHASQENTFSVDGHEHLKYHVVIPDVAAPTFQALVHYIYTARIRFAPLKSQGREARRTELSEHRTNFPKMPPLCSPKSIYRLADIVDMPELKELALEDIQSKITADSIAKEIFSPFSSTYEEILNMELKILYADATMAKVMPEIIKTVPLLVGGGMAHGENVVTALLLKLSALLAGPNYVRGTST